MTEADRVVYYTLATPAGGPARGRTATSAETPGPAVATATLTAAAGSGPVLAAAAALAASATATPPASTPAAGGGPGEAAAAAVAGVTLRTACATGRGSGACGTSPFSWRGGAGARRAARAARVHNAYPPPRSGLASAAAEGSGACACDGWPTATCPRLISAQASCCWCRRRRSGTRASTERWTKRGGTRRECRRAAPCASLAPDPPSSPLHFPTPDPLHFPTRCRKCALCVPAVAFDGHVAGVIECTNKVGNGFAALLAWPHVQLWRAAGRGWEFHGLGCQAR